MRRVGAVLAAVGLLVLGAVSMFGRRQMTVVR